MQVNSTVESQLKPSMKIIFVQMLSKIVRWITTTYWQPQILQSIWPPSITCKKKSSITSLTFDYLSDILTYSTLKVLNKLSFVLCTNYQQLSLEELSPAAIKQLVLTPAINCGRSDVNFRHRCTRCITYIEIHFKVSIGLVSLLFLSLWN